MASRAAYRAIGGGVVVIALSGAGACVLADPPAEIPKAPIQPVVIIRVEVQPPITAFLDTLPPEVYVPVYADPRPPAPSQVEGQFFVDGLLALSRRFAPISSAGRASVLFPVPAAVPGKEECHTLEAIISYPGLSLPGDSVTWFYSPTRSFAGCPVFDAGPPDAAPDADAAGSGD